MIGTVTAVCCRSFPLLAIDPSDGTRKGLTPEELKENYEHFSPEGPHSPFDANGRPKLIGINELYPYLIPQGTHPDKERHEYNCLFLSNSGRCFIHNAPNRSVICIQKTASRACITCMSTWCDFYPRWRKR